MKDEPQISGNCKEVNIMGLNIYNKKKEKVAQKEYKTQKFAPWVFKRYHTMQ